MKKQKFNLQALLLLWLTSALWGFAFVAQKSGMNYIGPFTFNGIRFALGALSLLPVVYISNRSRNTTTSINFGAFRGGILAGLVLFAGASLQQYGIVWTTAGKAGFITGLYVIIVPLIGLLIGQKSAGHLWTGAILAFTGLYFLTSPGSLSMGTGDLLVFLSALFWAIHVQLINSLVKSIQPLVLSIIQFATCSILSNLVALFTEDIHTSAILNASLPLLYGGIVSVGVAYTLQVYAQQFISPVNASIILSFETVFAVIGGWLLLRENLTIAGVFGCLLMLAGMLYAQLGPRIKKSPLP